VARDRQRAKQRQAARRAERLAERRDERRTARTSAPDEGLPDEAVHDDELEELADLDVGAPPQDVGRSDTVLEAPPNPYDADVLDDADLEADGDGAAVAAGPVGRRGERAVGARHGRLVAFLIAVWAELQRVQWPNRTQVISLTGVVLFFVLIIGGYLGGLDAIFSKLISLIL
jgi:preprotein translocase subunit SecE